MNPEPRLSYPTIEEQDPVAYGRSLIEHRHNEDRAFKKAILYKPDRPKLQRRG